ncbi:MAG: Serine/threonine-protein kinase HipA [Syntrophus sp. PtaB.Bin138]|nr:MAG: Serine/threonine-protein kinase HipA [Syntrophus sp. PtaB.Bin138]OPY91516.1 MAG: Serine/threonine-protein kinase HipA [Syntrophus sp. PtaU1.Bin208]
MNRCPITYEDCGEQRYSIRGLHLLSRRLTRLQDFPYSAAQQRREAVRRVGKMSIQGVQPKLSAVLNVEANTFEIVESGGRYIVKPQMSDYPEVPENEDLTMKMAAAAGLEAPFHGLIHSKDGSLSYVIRRFDRTGRTNRIPLEDFAQLLGHDRDTKYASSMEQVSSVLDRFCTFPAIEKLKLFKLVLFNYLSGNEDAHLKNFSLIRRDEKVELSPVYDLLNSTIIIDSKEELALPLNGKKSKLKREDFVDYFAKERLGLTDKAISRTIGELETAYPHWMDLLGRGFLSDTRKTIYRELLDRRMQTLGLTFH